MELNMVECPDYHPEDPRKHYPAKRGQRRLDATHSSCSLCFLWETHLLIYSILPTIIVAQGLVRRKACQGVVVTARDYPYRKELAVPGVKSKYAQVVHACEHGQPERTYF